MDPDELNRLRQEYMGSTIEWRNLAVRAANGNLADQRKVTAVLKSFHE